MMAKGIAKNNSRVGAFMDVINLILEIIDLYLIGGIKPPHLMWPIKVMLHPWFIHVASGLSSSPRNCFGVNSLLLFVEKRP